MCNLIHFSLAELARIAPDALRGMGLPHGSVERATDALVWGEAVHGLGLRYLMENEIEIRDSNQRLFNVVADEEHLGVLTIDAGGKTTLESMPRALDISVALTRDNEVGICLVRNTRGLFFLGEAITRAKRRQCPTVIAYSAGVGRLDTFEGTGAISLLPEVAHHIPVPQGLAAVSGAAGRNAWDAAVTFLNDRTNRQSEGSAFAIICLRSDEHPVNLREEARCGDEQQAWCKIDDFPTLLRRATSDGLEAGTEEWNRFAEYGRRIRVPNSARSALQAG